MAYLPGEERPHYAVRRYGGDRQRLTRWTVDAAEATGWLALFDLPVMLDHDGLPLGILPHPGQFGVTLLCEWRTWQCSPAEYARSPDAAVWRDLEARVTATTRPSVRVRRG